MRALLVLVASLWCRVASAACPDPYTGVELASDLSALGTSLRDQDNERFAAAAKKVEDGLLCAEQAFPRMAYASAYRYLGVAHYRSGDEAGARRWFRTALELESTYNWDVDEMDFADPLRAIFEVERGVAGVAAVPVQGQALATVEGSQWLLDGRLLTIPSATPDRPHLLQQVSTADQRVQAAFLIDGNTFPAEALRATVVVAEAPPPRARKSKQPAPAQVTGKTEDGYQVVRIERIRPPLKTPLLVAGGVGLLGGGAVYALSYMSRQDFEAATTTDALYAAQKKTNLLVLASGGVFAVGLGVGYVGVTLDSGPGWFFGTRF